MKNICFLNALLAAGTIALPVSQAGAELVAGWDFSQFYGKTTVLKDGAETAVTSLWANYSGLAKDTITTPTDTITSTDGLTGPDDTAYGTFYFAGQYGSSVFDTSINFSGGGTTSLNDNGSVSSLWEHPFSYADAPTYLLAAGQESTTGTGIAIEKWAVTTKPDNSNKSFVFEANTGTTKVGSNWIFKADITTNSGTTSLVWSWSTDGEHYTEFLTETVSDMVDATISTLHTVDLSSVSALNGVDEIFIKGAVGDITVTARSNMVNMDNVSITADLSNPGSPVTPANPFGGTVLADYPEYFISSWFMPYYCASGSCFYYGFHYDLGWIWTGSSSGENIYFWSYNLGRWCYTSSTIFPTYGSWDATTGVWAGWADFSVSN